MRPPARSKVATLGLALCLALAGCGGDDDGGGSDGGDTRKEARDVVSGYFKAVVAGNSEKACSTFLTKAGVTNVYGQDTCKDVIDFIPGPVGIESVKESGDTTSVVVHLSPATADERIVSLREEDGSLKIDAIERPE